MATSFAALVFRPSEISDEALAQGFAVALAGWDVPAPHLTISPLERFPGVSAAFYESGRRIRRETEDDEFDHVTELFEDELSPPVAVLDFVENPAATVYAVVISEDRAHDDCWRFDAKGFVRHFVRDGEDGLEAGVETPEAVDVEAVELDLPDDAPADREEAALERATADHRGSTFLSQELGAPVLPALMGALFTAERRLDVRLVAAGPAAIEVEVRRLNRTLGRSDGRGSFVPPQKLWGAEIPASFEAFVRTYDWADPKDPEDLYRDLSIGAIIGTLHFFRERDLRAREGAPAGVNGVQGGRYPIAALRNSGLGRSGPETTLALAADGDRLLIMQPGRAIEAGPRFGELVRYLALGWARRTEAEEDVIGALMLKARIRCEAD